MHAAPSRPTRPTGSPRPDAARWAEVIKLVAWHLHSLRDLVQLSQEQLARRAGVSQGAISRMEGGRCVNTPLLSYVKVVSALCREFGPLRDKLTPDVQTVLAFVERVLAVPSTRTPLALFEDVTLQTLIRVYARLAPEGRATFGEVIDTLGRWMLERTEVKSCSESS